MHFFTPVVDVLLTSMPLAAIYALLALSWVILFRMSDMLNLATGQFMLAGAFAVYYFVVVQGWPFALGMAVGLLLASVVAGVLYLLLFQRLAGLPPFAVIIATFGLAMLLDGLLSATVGTSSYVLEAPFEREVYQVADGAIVSNTGVYSMGFTLMVFAVVMGTLRFTKIGLDSRATAEDASLAARRGVRMRPIIAIAWCLSMAVAGAAGVLNAQTSILSVGQSDLGLRGLAPAFLGGLDSIGGALVGALLLAVLETLSTRWLGGSSQNAVAWGVIFVVLIVRPSGLFGSQKLQRV